MEIDGSKTLRVKVRPSVNGSLVHETPINALRILEREPLTKPIHATKATGAMFLKMRKTRHLVASLSDDDFLQLPMTKDPEQALAMKLLFHASVVCYRVGLENEMADYSIRAVELTLEHGLSPFTAPCFAMFGLSELALCRKQLDSAYRAGSLALQLVHRCRCSETESATLAITGSLLLHWKMPIRDLVSLFNTSASLGLECGDYTFRGFALMNWILSKQIMGTNLHALEILVRSNRRTCPSWITCDSSMLLCVLPIAQFAANTQRHYTKDVTTLTGEWMNEQDMQGIAKEENNATLRWIMLFVKLQLAFHFGAYLIAENLLEEMDSIVKSARHHLSVPTYLFYGACTHFELYRRLGMRRHLKRARNYVRALRKISYSPNAAPFLSLLEAENLSVSRRAEKLNVLAAYSVSIDHLDDLGWNHIAALACERAGFFLGQMYSDRTYVANHFFDQAIYQYKQWGATAKKEWLEEKRKKIFEHVDDWTLNSATAGRLVESNEELATIAEV